MTMDLLPLKRTLKRFLFSPTMGRLLPHEVTVQRHGINFCLELSDDIQFGIYFGYYERKYIQLIMDIVPAGGVCVDLGANIGALALTMARTAGPTGAVYAFEPDPGVFALLEKNKSLNSWATNLRPIRLAMSSQSGTVAFNSSDGTQHSGWGSIERFDDIAASVIQVETTTLDAFCAREEIHHIDLLKIDVEAHEFQVLSGAAGLLHSQAVSQVLIEFNGPRLAERGKTFADLLQVFAAHGYCPSRRINANLLDSFRHDEEQARKSCENFLFTPI